MTTDPLADWPDRTPLHDGADRLVLVFTATEHAYREWRWADGVWRPVDVPVMHAVTVAMQAFAGWAVSTADPELSAALVDAGAQTIRHAHSMSHDLQRLPPRQPPPGLTIEPLDPQGLVELAELLGPVLFAAYPAGHPDHVHDDVDASVQALRRVAGGDVLGPLLPASTVARESTEVVGACLVVDREGRPPDGGPWVLDVFRDPSRQVRGVGRALLVEALWLCAHGAAPALSLVVSHDNVAARRLYEAVGFVHTSESHTMVVPSL